MFLSLQKHDRKLIRLKLGTILASISNKSIIWVVLNLGENEVFLESNYEESRCVWAVLLKSWWCWSPHLIPAVFKLLALGFETNIFAVFEQQVFGTFKDSLVFCRGLTISAVLYFITDPVKLGHHMEQIKDDFSLRKLFLTALINGFHISITMASMQSLCCFA